MVHNCLTKTNRTSIALPGRYIFYFRKGLNSLDWVLWVMSNDSLVPWDRNGFHSFGNCKDIKSVKAWHPTLCKSHPRRLCLVSHFFLHPGREIHTSTRVQSPSSEWQKVPVCFLLIPVWPITKVNIVWILFRTRQRSGVWFISYDEINRNEHLSWNVAKFADILPKLICIPVCYPILSRLTC